MQVFQDSVVQKNKRTAENYPTDLFSKPYSIQMISDCFQQFVAEARRADGTCYLPRTIFQLLTGLLRHSRKVQSNAPNFLDRTDTRFKELHGACDATFHTLHQQEIGMTKQSAEIYPRDKRYAVRS